VLSLQNLAGGFAGLDVLVLGDAILDTYLVGGSISLSREAPVPVVTVERRTNVPGGAANAAVNVAALGARTHFLSVAGDDADGTTLRAALVDAGVDCADLLLQPGRPTVAKRRLIANGQLLARFDEGAVEPPAPPVEDALLERLEQRFPACAAVIVSDYGYRTISARVIDRLTRLQRTSPRVLVVDARALDRYRGIGATAVKPNWDEACALLGGSLASGAGRVDVLSAGADELLSRTGAHIVAVTLDRDGAVLFERRRPAYRTYTRPHAAARTAGAGDTFTAGLALALAVDAELPAAAEIASAAAAVVVARDGTSSCSAADLAQHLAGATLRLADTAALAQRAAFLRRQGRRVVFTNGVFDLLHRGHIDFLNRAKSLGDVLIVGLNSDASVAALKGPDRPINSLEDRAGVLAALSCVDHLASFDGDTAAELIELIRPDLYVKGGDYTPAMLPEAALVERLGGAVQILPYLEDRSTSAIVERIRAVPWQRVDLVDRSAAIESPAYDDPLRR